MTFGSIYNEIENDPSLAPQNVEGEVLDNNIIRPEEEEEETTEGIQPVSPTQQAEEQIGIPKVVNQPVSDSQVLPNLTDPKVKQQMIEDQKIWWDMPKGDERTAVKDEWINKYWGSRRNYNNQHSIYGSANPIEVVGDTMQTLAAMGEGLFGFGMDLLGNLPGLGGLDNAYDRWTAKVFNNESSTAIREVSKIVLPSILSGNFVSGLVGKSRFAGYLGKWQQFGVGLGLNTVLDSAIVSAVDQSADVNYFQKMHESQFMNLFGKDQLFEVPEILRVMGHDSPFMNRFSAGMVDLPFSFLGNTIGWGMWLKANPKGGKVLGWMEPLDDTAATYKNNATLSFEDSNNIKRMEELNKLLAEGKLNKVDEAEAIDELILLEEATGKLDDIEKALLIDDELTKSEEVLSAKRKIEENGGKIPNEKVDGDISPGIKDSTQRTPTPGNVAKNKADLAAIRNGTSVGDPSSIDTELARKGTGTDMPSRKTTVNISKVNTGDFEAVIDGFKISKKEMQAAAWGYYADIVNPDRTVGDVKALFSNNKDIKSLVSGKLQIEYISDDKFHAAMLAVRDLMDIYTGQAVNETSARVMASLGFDIRTISESQFLYKGLVDWDKGMDRLLGKINYLLDETELSNYVAGWSLKNRDWLAEAPLENLQEAADSLLTVFNERAISIHAKNRRFVETLRKAKDLQPEALRALTAAFVQSDGNVDTISKLLKFAAEEISPLGMIKSPNPRRMSLFAKSLWGVVFNNVLSAGSAAKAGLAGQVIHTAKYMSAFPGHLFWGVVDGDVMGSLHRAAFYYKDGMRTYKKALGYAWSQMKKTHRDPTTMMRNYRKDFIFQNFKTQAIVDDVRKGFWEPDANWGRLFQHDFQSGLFKLSQMQWARYPMTLMSAPDAFSKYTMAHKTAGLKAFEDVISEYGWADPKKLKKARIKYRRSFFDKDGRLVDDWVGKQADDINFTADDGVTKYINEATTAFPILRYNFMFPRTETNAVKFAFSYTPVALIPGSSKISKTLYANSDDSIRIALKEHGINFDTDPHAMAIFKDLRAEYTGRLFWGMFLSKLGYDYAMDGGCTGSGHYDPRRRAREAKELGLKYKTCRIPGTNKRVSYQGIPILETLLTLQSDLVYYSKDINETMMENIQAKVGASLASAFGVGQLDSLEGLAKLLVLDDSTVERWLKRAATATFVPAEIRQLTKAVDNALKMVREDLINFIKSLNPITIGEVPTARATLTGLPVRDTNNGLLRWVNAFSGVLKISEDNLDAPDRDKLIRIKLPNGKIYKGTSQDVLKDLVQYTFSEMSVNTKSGIKYTEPQMEKLVLAMHSIGGRDLKEGSELFWKIHDILSSQKYHDELFLIRGAMVDANVINTPDLKLKLESTQMYRELRAIIKEYKGIAETTIDLNELINAQKEIDYEVGEGNINEAVKIQQRNTKRQELLEYGGSR